jgi:hypothetical protein
MWKWNFAPARTQSGYNRSQLDVTKINRFIYIHGTIYNFSTCLHFLVYLISTICDYKEPELPLTKKPIRTGTRIGMAHNALQYMQIQGSGSPAKNNMSPLAQLQSESSWSAPQQLNRMTRASWINKLHSTSSQWVSIYHIVCSLAAFLFWRSRFIFRCCCSV